MKRSLLAPLLLLDLGCGGDASEAQEVLAANGPLGTIVAFSENATFEVGPLLLSIPEGALSEETEISISTISQTSHDLLGDAPVFSFAPEGLRFSKPIEVRVP